MQFLALATDYDGTIATNSVVDNATIVALENLKTSGRRLILVTGRVLNELIEVFPQFELFDAIVAENGALLFDPKTRETVLLCAAPNEGFVARLRTENVAPLSIGHCIVATWEPHEQAVLKAIHELGLELQIVFNKGAVMVLPSNVNKATGLAAALEKLKLSSDKVVGVGDAENDHAFLAVCGCSVAVANAVPALKEMADLVTRHDHGAGVCELIEAMIATDLEAAAIESDPLRDAGEARQRLRALIEHRYAVSAKAS